MAKPTQMVDKLRNARTRVYLPEILESVNDELKAGNRDTAISLLQTYNAKNPEHANRMRDYLQSLYHPMVKLDLPDTPPPFDDTQYIDFDFAPLTLEKAMQRIKYFVKSHSGYIENVVRRELMFIQTLEALQKRDAELYVSILLKKFPSDTYPYIDISIFNEALPQYFTGINVDEIKERNTETATRVITEPAVQEVVITSNSEDDVIKVEEVQIKPPVRKTVKKPSATTAPSKSSTRTSTKTKTNTTPSPSAQKKTPKTVAGKAAVKKTPATRKTPAKPRTPKTPVEGK